MEEYRLDIVEINSARGRWKRDGESGIPELLPDSWGAERGC